jgi:hypothetical protein
LRAIKDLPPGWQAVIYAVTGAVCLTVIALAIIDAVR